ncbi:hypothetical protein Taro_023084 [Colocasia esculenta]|uniref:Mediator of RNA polymerase II transcription subunit 4 n=1 Tax=Colocasia esculenta TaxID=4460 RepID=A0A843VDE6_COLES|nr:hypothetical protein [Colocasia esculenta]
MLQNHTPPPILPSPARLGLTNPNSPSLPPNPNPNTSPSPGPAPKAVPPAAPARPPRLPNASSTLLPLLPPLSRAQSLLLQMSALASKLFEVSPHRALWLASFRGSLPSFLAPTNAGVPTAVDLPPVSSTKDVISLFTSLQTQLFEAVAELQEIVDLQQSKVKVSDEVQARDATLLCFAKKIREAERVLDQLVEDYSDYRKNSKRAKRDGEMESDPKALDFYSSLNLSDILGYAHKISYTTFAPPEFGAGQAPLRGALPPAPQEEQLRASQLYHFADLDVGVPKKAPESKERGPETLVEAMKERTPAREEPPMGVPGMLLPINVPPGWKKGMPIQLPSDLPPMPPGWKPGDPVPLPPFNDLLGAARGEEQRVAAPSTLPAVQVPLPRAPEVIQVKRVQLDINPDEDDYSSEYSSEVGSSDEDDEE